MILKIHVQNRLVISGKSMKDAKFLRRGLHMTSYDKNDQQGGALNYTSRPALRYDSDSTTNSGQNHHQQHQVQHPQLY